MLTRNQPLLTWPRFVNEASAYVHFRASPFFPPRTTTTTAWKPYLSPFIWPVAPPLAENQTITTQPESEKTCPEFLFPLLQPCSLSSHLIDVIHELVARLETLWAAITQILSFPCSNNTLGRRFTLRENGNRALRTISLQLLGWQLSNCGFQLKLMTT